MSPVLLLGLVGAAAALLPPLWRFSILVTSAWRAGQRASLSKRFVAGNLGAITGAGAGGLGGGLLVGLVVGATEVSAGVWIAAGAAGLFALAGSRVGYYTASQRYGQDMRSLGIEHNAFGYMSFSLLVWVLMSQVPAALVGLFVRLLSS